MIRTLQARCCQTMTLDFCLQASPPKWLVFLEQNLSSQKQERIPLYLIKDEKELKHSPQLETGRAQRTRSKCELKTRE